MAEKKSQGEMKRGNDEQYECQLSQSDQVYRYHEKKGEIQYGIVTETSEDASRDVAPSKSHQLKKGQIRVHWWPTGQEEILLEEQVNNFSFSVQRCIAKCDTLLGFIV